LAPRRSAPPRTTPTTFTRRCSPRSVPKARRSHSCAVHTSALSFRHPRPTTSRRQPARRWSCRYGRRNAPRSSVSARVTAPEARSPTTMSTAEPTRERASHDRGSHARAVDLPMRRSPSTVRLPVHLPAMSRSSTRDLVQPSPLEVNDSRRLT
jgi:hypothetical protein